MAEKREGVRPPLSLNNHPDPRPPSLRAQRASFNAELLDRSVEEVRDAVEVLLQAGLSLPPRVTVDLP